MHVYLYTVYTLYTVQCTVHIWVYLLYISTGGIPPIVDYIDHQGIHVPGSIQIHSEYT